MTLSPDLSIGDRYLLEDRIAIGGMGEVWRAHDRVLSRRVAVKVLKASYASDPQFIDRFRNEAKHTAALSHPGIAGVFDYGEVGDMAYLVMELVLGEPLSDVLAREGRLSADRTLDIVGQAGLALQAAHDAGIVHRDVKPGNLILRPDGVVKVTDFGIARAVSAAPITQTGLVVGTAAYLSPEQAAGRPATPASDVYSLGLVTYECLAGARPFTGDTPVGVAMAHINTPPPPLPKDVPPLVADFVQRALAKDPDRRQPSAGDFGRTALALAAATRDPHRDTRVLTGVVPSAVTGPPVPEGGAEAGFDDRERRRIRNLFVAIGVAVVVLGFVLLRSCTGGAQQTTVPKVTGQSYDVVAGALHTQGLNVTQRRVHDALHSAGLVLGQSLAPGRRVSTGSTIVLTVSSGPALVTVNASEFLGQPEQQAQTALTSRHLHVRVITQASTAAPGTVIAVDPVGPVREESTVTLTVAAAPGPPVRGKHGGKDGKGGPGG
jgi:hypothetical protein